MSHRWHKYNHDTVKKQSQFADINAATKIQLSLHLLGDFKYSVVTNYSWINEANDFHHIFMCVILLWFVLGLFLLFGWIRPWTNCLVDQNMCLCSGTGRTVHRMQPNRQWEKGVISIPAWSFTVNCYVNIESGSQETFIQFEVRFLKQPSFIKVRQCRLVSCNPYTSHCRTGSQALLWEKIQEPPSQ